MDKRDVALQSVMPTVMVPRYSEHKRMTSVGKRILIASNGVWLEMNTAWLYACVQVAPALTVTVPYGHAERTIEFKFGKMPKVMVEQFIAYARTRSPNECAAWIVWNERNNAWHLRVLEETSVGRGHVNVNLPILEEGEHLIIDIHSHGELTAFFSSTDNKDDFGAVQVSGVVGNLNNEEVTTVFRLCLGELLLPLQF